MRPRSVEGTAEGENLSGFFVDFHHQWDSFSLRPKNWRDFTLIDIGGEWAGYSSRWEFSVCLIGLRVTITYVYDETFNREMLAQVDKWLNRKKPDDGEPLI